jgi:hypothetical protein
MSGLNGTLQIEVSIAPATSRKGGQRRNTAGPKVPEPPRVPRIARLMALAVKFQDMVDRGEVRDYADLARLGFVTRARLTQIMNLMQTGVERKGRARARPLVSLGGGPTGGTAGTNVQNLHRISHFACVVPST